MAAEKFNLLMRPKNGSLLFENKRGELGAGVGWNIYKHFCIWHFTFDPWLNGTTDGRRLAQIIFATEFSEDSEKLDRINRINMIKYNFYHGGHEEHGGGYGRSWDLVDPFSGPILETRFCDSPEKRLQRAIACP